MVLVVQKMLLQEEQVKMVDLVAVELDLIPHRQVELPLQVKDLLVELEVITALAAAPMDVVLVEEVLVVSVETVLKVLVQPQVEEHLGQVDLEKNSIFQVRRNFTLVEAVEDIGEELVVEPLLHKVVQEEVALVESVVDYSLQLLRWVQTD